VVPLRLFDPDRRPTSWTEIVQPGQYVVFSKTIDTGAPCDADGQPFASVEDATCLVFDELEAAHAFCEGQVVRVPAVRFEIFDSTGRAHAPLLVVVHPSKAARLEGNPRGMRVRTRAAVAMMFVAAALFWYDYQHDKGVMIFPTIVGINLIVIAARFIQLNASYAHAERHRRQRLAEHVGREAGTADGKRLPSP
jgi:hypothetical protein